MLGAAGVDRGLIPRRAMRTRSESSITTQSYPQLDGGSIGFRLHQAGRLRQHSVRLICAGTLAHAARSQAAERSA